MKLSPPRALGTAKAGCLKRPNAPLSARGSGCGASEEDCKTWCLTLSFERESPVSRNVFPGCREAPGEGPEAAPCERDGRCHGALIPEDVSAVGAGLGFRLQEPRSSLTSHRPSGLTCGDSVFLAEGDGNGPLLSRVKMSETMWRNHPERRRPLCVWWEFGIKLLGRERENLIRKRANRSPGLSRTMGAATPRGRRSGRCDHRQLAPQGSPSA